jgi:hypothetical protein
VQVSELGRIGERFIDREDDVTEPNPVEIPACSQPGRKLVTNPGCIVRISDDIITNETVTVS